MIIFAIAKIHLHSAEGRLSFGAADRIIPHYAQSSYTPTVSYPSPREMIE